MNDISEETHEFRQGNISDLFSTVLIVLEIPDTIMSNQSLGEMVNDKISKSEKFFKKKLSNYSNGNNAIGEQTGDQIKKAKTNYYEKEFNALATICKTVFGIIYITKDTNVTSSVHVRYYGEEISSNQECVYIICDETHKHVSPLYLFNKSNPDESKTIFGRKDSMINVLLRKFFNENFKCKKKQKKILNTKIIILFYSKMINLCYWITMLVLWDMMCHLKYKVS
jgi:hypothetical protein